MRCELYGCVNRFHQSVSRADSLQLGLLMPVPVGSILSEHVEMEGEME